jgi:methylmalonyl-CoA mutase cobalamin-binding subunit
VSNVFISYARADRESVEQLVRALRAANITGWLDATDIAAGASVSSAVREALQRSSAVIVFLSHNALHNQWVQFEIGAAEALGKTIIPVIVSGNQLEKHLPDILKERKVIDARSQPYAAVVNEIRRALERAQ